MVAQWPRMAAFLAMQNEAKGLHTRALADADCPPIAAQWRYFEQGEGAQSKNSSAPFELLPSSLTFSQKRASVTMWMMAQSPIVVGGALPLDEATLGLLTHREVLSINQNASQTTVVVGGCDSVGRPTCVWLSRFHGTGVFYRGLFNLGKERAQMSLRPPEIECDEPYDVWAGEPVRVEPGAKGGASPRVALEAGSALLVRCGKKPSEAQM